MADVKLGDHTKLTIMLAVDELVRDAVWDFLCTKGEVKTVGAFYNHDVVSHPSLKEEHAEELEAFIRERFRQPTPDEIIIEGLELTIRRTKRT